MLTVGQAHRRDRWYPAPAWVIAFACLAFYVLSALKAGVIATQHYAEWPYPLSLFGWAVQRAAMFVYHLLIGHQEAALLAVAAIRVKGGESASQDRLWQALDSSNQQLRAHAGQSLPDLRSPYGTTIWQRVGD